jgi:predicted dinucleotide-binding enzyme
VIRYGGGAQAGGAGEPGGQDPHRRGESAGLLSGDASLTVCNTDSLGEQIQRAYPEVRVVKTLNTLNCSVMADPALVPGDHDLFVSGDDPAARARVAEWLHDRFG